jgi:hypothetical protein
MVLDLITIVVIISSLILFFVCSYMHPGYVAASLNWIDVLKIGNDKNIDLENFCFYCKVIKSMRAFHCQVCGKCVEKFDHHCVYINNCLGYRNHKYFIFFLLSMISYIIVSIVTRLIDFIYIEINFYKDKLETPLLFYVEIFIFAYTLVINLGLMIPLTYQIIE